MTPKCTNTVISNLWFGLMHFDKAGYKVEGHKHVFDHVTLLSHGKFRVIKFKLSGEVDIDEILDSPCLVHIHKDHLHSIEALTDDAVACCCHGIYEAESSLFPIDTNNIPIVGGTLKISLIKDNTI